MGSPLTRTAGLLFAIIAGVLIAISCSTRLERTAPFAGKLIVDSTALADAFATLDSARITGAIDGAIGYLVYDRECDGVYNDTLALISAGGGAFGGVLIYTHREPITASWLRKPVRVVFEYLGVDSLLFCQAWHPNEPLDTHTVDYWLLRAHFGKAAPATEPDSSDLYQLP